MEPLEAFDHSPDVVALVRSDGAVVASNRPLPSHRIVEWLTPSDPIEAALSRVGAGGAPEVHDATTRDGATVYQVSLAPTTTGEVALVASDVTARRRSEERLRRSEAMLVDAQGVAHLGTWEWDVREPNASWSDELYRIYAVAPETYTPTYEAYLEMVHPDDRAYVRAATERVFKEHEPYSHDERIIRPDGTIRYLHTWAYPMLDKDGQLVRLIGVCQDITDRKAAEIALAERALELSSSNEKLREEMAERARVEHELRRTQKLDALGRLAGGIAHDFNNLLGVVLGRASLMASRLPAGDASRDHLDEIAQAARQAARLTQQLLLFGREDKSKQEAVHVGRTVEHLGAVLASLVGEHIDFVTRIADVASWVEADRSQLEQVVMNLVVNARDAMPRGGKLTLEVVEAPPGEVLPAELDPARSWLVLVVTDTGVGIEPAVAAKVFDPYFTTKTDGHGLGLSTVYGIVRKAGGTVTVTSTPGQGARFCVFLPMAPAPREKSVATAGEDLRGAATILLVEDQDSVRRVLIQLLGDLGYRVLSAPTAREALDLASRFGSPIDLLVTDVVMPQMNGPELARAVRAAGGPKMRVLYVTGWANDALLDEIQADDAPVLRKPFGAEELARAVRDALRSSPT